MPKVGDVDECTLPSSGQPAGNCWGVWSRCHAYPSNSRGFARSRHLFKPFPPVALYFRDDLVHFPLLLAQEYPDTSQINFDLARFWLKYHF